jgi:hypothetical protein
LHFTLLVPLKLILQQAVRERASRTDRISPRWLEYRLGGGSIAKMAVSAKSDCELHGFARQR